MCERERYMGAYRAPADVWESVRTVAKGDSVGALISSYGIWA